MYYKFNKENLDFEKANLQPRIIKGSILATGLLLLMGVSIPEVKTDTKYLTQEEKLIVIRDNNKFSEEKLIEKIDQLNFRFPHIIFAQSKLESGNYKSGIFLENNNMFGMKEARIRANLAKGTNRGHAYFDTWQDCVLDYALYYSTYLYKLKTEKEYFEYLGQNYAEDPSYVIRLKSIIKKEKLREKFGKAK